MRCDLDAHDSVDEHRPGRLCASLEERRHRLRAADLRDSRAEPRRSGVEDQEALFAYVAGL
jgi:hypothetical protein